MSSEGARWRPRCRGWFARGPPQVDWRGTTLSLVVRSEDVAAAAAALADGGIVAYPTETVYGLGVDARRPQAIDALLCLKGRDAGRGISVLVTGFAAAAPLLASSPPREALVLAEHFWPGPLTIVLAASETVAQPLIGPSGGIGLRCSSDPWAAALVAHFGGPVTSTSANPSGMDAARSAAEVRTLFAGQAMRYTLLDGGERLGSEVSTVVEFAGGRWSVLRRGAVGMEALARVIPLQE